MYIDIWYGPKIFDMLLIYSFSLCEDKKTRFVLEENNSWKLANVTVVASNVSFPPSTPPSQETMGHQFFAQYVGVLPAGSTVSLFGADGPVSAQFVYVYLPRTVQLILCEVEVFGISKFRICPCLIKAVKICTILHVSICMDMYMYVYIYIYVYICFRLCVSAFVCAQVCFTRCTQASHIIQHVFYHEIKKYIELISFAQFTHLNQHLGCSRPHTRTHILTNLHVYQFICFSLPVSLCEPVRVFCSIVYDQHNAHIQNVSIWIIFVS